MPPKPCKTLFLNSPRPYVTSATPDGNPHTSAPLSRLINRPHAVPNCRLNHNAMTRYLCHNAMTRYLCQRALCLPFATLGTTVRGVHCCPGWEKLPFRMTAPKKAGPRPAFFCDSCRMRSLLETSQPIANRKSGTCAGRSRKHQRAPAPQRGSRGTHQGAFSKRACGAVDDDSPAPPQRAPRRCSRSQTGADALCSPTGCAWHRTRPSRPSSCAAERSPAGRACAATSRREDRVFER